MSQRIAVIASAPPLDEADGPSTSSSGGASSTSRGLVEREYVIQPNTIIELVDLYVPPVRSEFRIPIFQAPDEALALNTPTPTTTPGIRGRRRGRPPLGNRPSGVTPRKPYKRRPRPETPPPLPPVPNYLAHVINPLENEIYPKVIVLPARLPFVIPKNLNDDPPPPPPPIPAPPPPAPATAPKQPQNQPQPPPPGVDDYSAKEAAQLRENLKLFGPNVTVSKVTSHGQSRYLAVHKKPNGEQRKIMFTASQLQAFVASGGADQVASGSTWPRPNINHLRPGPSPRPRVSSPPPPEQPKRVIVEPPPNFRLPTMAALRAAAQQSARRGGFNGGAAAGSRGGGGMGLGIMPMDMGLGMGIAGTPQAKAKEQATTMEAPKMGNTSASASTPVPASARALTEAEAMPPPPPRPLAMEMSRSRVPSILTRKSQLRLINERAKRAAEKVGGDAKKYQNSLGETRKERNV